MPGDAKAAFKEGGKKGVDLQGVAALGGVQYFNIAVETPEGDMALLEKVLEGANVEVDEAAEERKGGAGDLGKFFLSAGETKLVGLGHVPKALAEAKGLTVKEWAAELMQHMPKSKILEETDEVIKIEMPADTDNNVFPLKARDAAIDAGFKLLKRKGLVPDNADDSDDDVNYAEAAGVEW
uniref:Uncharacterized protein n=1 Tax=Chlamydomonas leiostraca TaxID=1034604 RepID=A0A7S0WZA9_9CHLO|mmetsp:Transcript_38118/g.96387  ORF Transcript_38118/g.96387 Transcript_38118/m.96387 type:complete len:181 (+) Transcript_38118:92-634(+)|eukprot:CAMPEP_0202862484 /NCGR_PEP_ID=MMETSP1391-20130828/3498_1 /ASSEMBLY_ACC=CAM_ASM_000867 /TAXON_ID=1034604 /ORGANISM="Chlamydomonas leiostraca, Strain SAG 11-49" /LENGTH=180 /DNA_ID=CAMNT_0049542029 /DNA_START=64 /DNA_END=606 /DNA_ORIENTATION=+